MASGELSEVRTTKQKIGDARDAGKELAKWARKAAIPGSEAMSFARKKDAEDEKTCKLETNCNLSAQRELPVSREGSQARGVRQPGPRTSGS